MYKMMTAAAAAFVLMAATFPAAAEEAAGDWAGVLGKDMKIALHLKRDSNGRYEGHMKSVEQGNAVIALDDIKATPDTLSFHGANKQLGVDGRYEGRWEDEKKQWTGLWTQGGQVELNFKRVGNAAIAAPRRPQEEAIAKGPLPYVNEEVAFNIPAPGVRIAGNFSKPKGKGPFPAVVLLAGSGASTRDAYHYGHKPLLVLADALNRAGIAVLRYDKRGVPPSMGDVEAATTADFAIDAEIATAWLMRRSDVDAKRVGIIGLSEGGAIAPVVAGIKPAVSYIVMLGGPAIPGDRNTLRQMVLRAEEDGETPQQIAGKQKVFEAAAAIIKASASREDAIVAMTALAQAAVANGQIDQATADFAVKRLTSPWFYYDLRNDPAPSLAKVRVPVLALYGALDRQVPPADNIPALRQALKDNPDVTIVEIPGVNHMLQPAKTGFISEYRTIEESVAPVVLKTVTDWVKAHTK